jgi:hypothetical protein
MLILFRVDHENVHEVLINGGIKTLKTDGAIKIDTVPFAELEPRMLDAGIIPNFRMQQKEALFPSGIPDPENDIFTDFQMSAAMGTNVMVIHLCNSDK